MVAGSSSGAPRGPKGQHSAPRGGPPRSWTNDELTKALENVWNKRMTTSQASRIYGIPYNSLLMYVRGKYGKSLKLDKLKKSTPAAHDTLNTIGNSRSTPKEKILARASKAIMSNLVHATQADQGSPTKDTLGLPEGHPGHVKLPSPLGDAGAGRIKDLLMEMHTQQTLLNRTEQLKELEKRLGAEHAKALLATLEQQQQAEKTWPVSPPVSNGSNSDTGLGSQADKMQGLFTSLLHHGHSPSALTPGSQAEAGGSDLEIEDEEEEEEIEVGEAEDEADVSKDMDEDMQDLLQEAAAKAAAAQVEAAAEDSCKDQLKATSSQKTSSLAQGSEISAV